MAVRAIDETDYEPPKVLRFTPPDDAGPQQVPAEQPAPERPVPPVRVVKQVDFPTAEVLAVLTLLAKILGTRVILALAGLGAFVLAFMAVNHNSLQAILSAAVYDLTVFGPCLYLALRKE